MNIRIGSAIVYVFPFLLHSIGLFLLTTKCAKIGKNQKYLIINLCLSEIFLTLTSSVRHLMLQLYGETSFIFQIVSTINLSSSFSYYMAMYLLTLDRFAEVYFNLKYPLYCTIRRLRYAMILLWSITGFWFIFLFVYMRKHGYDRIERFIIFISIL